MNAHCRYFPPPRPSLKSDRSSRTPYVYCSCNPPCSNESCTGQDQSRNFTNYSESATPPYPPQPPSPHVHFLGLYQTHIVDYEYDRSPTVVMPNECALPARGCPGKTYFCNFNNAARNGRLRGRCATPGGSRASSRNRNNLSPPPSPSLYAKHIFYPEEYPFPSPSPSPRAMAAPPLVPDTGLTPHTSDDSDQGISTPPEPASQTSTLSSISRRGTGYPSHTGSQLFIEAPGHPPIPGFTAAFAITNALNGLDLSNCGNDGVSPTGISPLDGPWKRRPSHTSPEATTPKKLKAKKSKSSLPGEANGTSAAKRTRVAPPAAAAAATSWRSDVGALGGF